MLFKNRSLLVTIIRRIILFAAVMLALSIFVFVLARLAPGDPLQSFYGDSLETMTQAEQDAARARLGLDQNIFVQYGHWIINVFRGDFGLSLKYKMPAMDVISPLIGNTLILGITAYVIVFALSTVLAVVCTLHEDDWLDRIICKVGTAVYYIPTFWLGVVLVLIFSVNLGWLPSSGAYDIGRSGDIFNRISHLTLPVIVMVASHMWYYTYMIRNKLLDETRKDYVLLSKSKGLGRREIVWKHCLRNVAPTIVSIMAVSIPHITGGTVIVEAIFAYPGIGNLAVESAKYHDYNLLMLSVLVTGMFVFISSFAAQTVNERIDPRMKGTEVIKW